jgi:hypothetical protein
MLAIIDPHVLKAEVPMKRALGILGSAIFLVIAPGTLAGYGPWAICRWRMAPPFFDFFPIRMVGVLLIAPACRYCSIPLPASPLKVWGRRLPSRLPSVWS